MTPAPVSVRDAIRRFAAPLTTARLVLDHTCSAHGDDLFALFNDWEVIRWLAQPDWPQSPDLFRGSLERIAAEQVAGDALYLTIFRQSRPIGGVVVANAVEGPILGYWIGRPHWGNGYMSEAAAAICAWVFTTTDATRLLSGAFVGNDASLKIQQKLGFTVIGRSKQFCVAYQRERDHFDTELRRPTKLSGA
jgi:RimJ/RimL family protein N-acetyltransferase